MFICSCGGRELHSSALFLSYFMKYFPQSLSNLHNKECIVILWCSFSAFWLGLDQNSRRRMSREKRDVILKLVVKHFFIEKEVASTLVMDSLYSGWKALEGLTKNKKSRPRLADTEELPAPIVSVDSDVFVLVDDVLLLIQRAALEPLPPKEERGPQTRTKVSFLSYAIY